MNCSYKHCNCISGNKCKFYQAYAEGSLYDGYVAEDQVYIGTNEEGTKKPFMFRFGCVKRETKYFYTQKVDGILGLSRKEDYRTR
jgi:hypothetical protein